jgi:hypothetical protein
MSALTLCLSPRPLLALGATLALALAGCDQLQDVVDKNKDKLNVPIEVAQKTALAIDIGAATGQLAGQKAPEAMETPLPLPPADVDLNKESQALADNKALIKRLEITGIDVAPSNNSVTGDLPAFELRIGAFGAKEAKDAVLIATVPAIPAGSAAPVSAVIDAAGMDAAQTHLLALAFSQHTVATLKVAQGGDVPGGKVDLELTMKLKATLNPVK